MSTDSDLLPIPAGSIFTITSGCYSDYSVAGAFRAKVDLDPGALRTEYLTEYPKAAKKYGFDEYKFLAWLTRKDVLEPVDGFEWHLGDYSCANEMTVTATEGCT